MDANAVLQRLKQTGPGAPLHALVALAVDALLDGPPRALLTDQEASAWARRLLQGFLESEGGSRALAELVERAANGLQRERRRLKDLAPHQLLGAVRSVLERPFTPDRRTVLGLIDRAPMRELVRAILLDAVLDFARKASAPVAGMVPKGLKGLARLAQEQVTSRSGTLGSLVGAVGSEVERQLERRAQDFVDASLSQVFGQVADVLCDPRQVEQATALRLAILDGALELTGPQLARELVNLDLPGAADTLRAGARRWLASPAAETALGAAARWALGLQDDVSLRARLEALGVAGPLRELALAQGEARLRELLETPAFRAWLEALLAG